MERKNIDGSPIFSDATWNRLLEIGDNLARFGYQESRSKPNLFQRPIRGGVSYADMRGTKEAPIWAYPCPYLYFFPTDRNMPADEKRAILKSEYIRLKSNGCRPRFSFYDVSEPDGLFFGDQDVTDDCGDDNSDRN